MSTVSCSLLSPLLLLTLVGRFAAIGDRVIWAVNCGGDEHIDSHGVRYQRDACTDGTASDYGRRYSFRRVPKEDEVLYQTERYHNKNFAYHVPIPTNGDYVLVLKFAEVWFTTKNAKV